MKKWQPVDCIVTLLALGVFLTIVTPMLGRILVPDLDLSQEGISALTQIVIALVSVISVYIGSKVNGKSK